MRVLYIIDDYHSVSQTFVRREIDMLRRSGVDVVVFPLHPSRFDAGTGVVPRRRGDVARGIASMLTHWRALRLLNGALRAYWPHPRTLLGQIFALALAATLSRRRLHFAHIHAHFFGRCADLAYFLASLTDASYTVTGHASEVLRPRDPAVLRRNALGAAGLVGESDLIADTLREVVSGRLPVITVRSGLPAAVLSTAPTHSGLRVPLELLTTARLVPKKGLAAIVEAAGLLDDRGLPFRWTLIGDGPMRSQLEAAVAELGLERRVRFLGALANEDALSLLRQADIFVLPCVALANGDSDGLPAALIESVALGIPAVTTAVAAIPELVRTRRDRDIGPAARRSCHR